ncbi:MAG: hypothetical protein NZ920_01835 [Aigarchaeota archaeon]|nr:hypothetical protein [Aigarchaeota archaeon]MDW8093184.1 hypothetical protein [Nitrososphaerota archaeon]
MRITRVIGVLLVTITPLLGAFYVAWSIGLLGWLDPELSVRVVVYVIVAAALIVGWLIGYVMLTAPAPVINSPRR